MPRDGAIPLLGAEGHRHQFWSHPMRSFLNQAQKFGSLCQVAGTRKWAGTPQRSTSKLSSDPWKTQIPKERRKKDLEPRAASRD